MRLKNPVLLCSFAILFGLEGARAAVPIETGSRVEVAPKAPDDRDQNSPDAAFDGKGTFLVVWQQGRNFYKGAGSDIFAMRVSAEGRPLDEKTIAICTAKGGQARPRVAFCGGVFLVVWQDLRNGKDFDCHAARVKPDGTLLDKDGFLVSGGPENQAMPEVAPGPGKFLVAWQDFRDGRVYTPHVARVTSDGRVADPQGVSAAPKGMQFSPALTASWKSGVSAGAKPMRPEGGEVSLARTDSGWFLFWRMASEPSAGGVARIEEKGGALAVAEVTAPLPQGGGYFGSAASDGKTVLYAGVTVGGRGRTHRPGTALLFDASSSKPKKNPNPPDRGVSTPQAQQAGVIGMSAIEPGLDPGVSAAAGEGLFLIVGKGSSAARKPACYRIVASRLAPDGKRLDDLNAWPVIDDGASPCLAPSVAAGKPGTFLVCYEVDGGPGKHRIVGRILRVK